MSLNGWGLKEFVCVLVFSCAINSTQASDLPSRQQPPAAPAVTTLMATDVIPYNWELRLGAYAHDMTSQEHTVADLNMEILTPELYRTKVPFVPFLNDIVIRANLGGTANFRGKTSQAYAGLVTEYDFTKEFYFESTLGGAVHTGATGKFAHLGHNPMGCAVAFHESASLGYRITDHWGVLATIEHTSNAGFCTQNRGLTNYGARVSYSF